MKKNPIFILTAILGIAILAATIFAKQIGIDQDARWGWGRLFVLLIGVSFLLSPFIYDAYQKMRRENQIAIVTMFGIALILLMYVWQVSFGYWGKWPKTTNYFDSLARAFQQGQVAILTKPDPALLALEDPYDFDLRTKTGVQTLFDLSLYKGKYYLYWGPVPSLLITPIKFFYEGEIGDHKVTFLFLAGLLVLNFLFAFRIWAAHFNDLPGWLFVLGVMVLGTINPIAWLLHRAHIYQAAISAGQFFLMAGLYLLYSTFRSRPLFRTKLFITGVLLSCAIGSRFTLALPVAYILILMIIRLYRAGTSGRIGNVKYAFALLPILFGIIGLGWYNWIRFGSISNFGLEYQVNNFNYPKGYTFFSLAYLPANIYNYFLLPFRVESHFPFIMASYAQEYSVFGLPVPVSYYPEAVCGILVASPFVILAGIPIYSIITRRFPDKNLSWLVIILTGTILLSMASVLLYFFGTMRFIGDFMPSLALLSVIGFWQGYRLFVSMRLGWVYDIISVPISIGTILIGTVLALSSTSKVPIYIPPNMIVEWFSRLSLLFK